MQAPTILSRRAFGAMMLASTAAACTPRLSDEEAVPVPEEFVDGYGPIEDAGYRLPGIPSEYLQGVNRRVSGTYNGEQRGNTLDVDPYAKFLYHVRTDGTTTRYPVGVGRAGKSIRGSATIRIKRQWPGWTPTANMIKEDPDLSYMPPGPGNPLGTHAMYLSWPAYLIHGTHDTRKIGRRSSSGCIGLYNEQIAELFSRCPVGTQVRII